MSHVWFNFNTCLTPTTTPLSLASWFICARPASHFSLHTQFPQSVYTCPPPTQLLVYIRQPSFSLVSWFACPGFILVCPSLHIPTSRKSLGSYMLILLVHSPLVRVCRPSRQPPGSCALLALCLCLLVSATWSHLFSFFLCSFVFVCVCLSFGGFIFGLPSLSVADMVST